MPGLYGQGGSCRIQWFSHNGQETACWMGLLSCVFFYTFQLADSSTPPLRARHLILPDMSSTACLVQVSSLTISATTFLSRLHLHQKLHQHTHVGILDNSWYDLVCAVLFLENACKCLIILDNSQLLSESRQWSRWISKKPINKGFSGNWKPRKNHFTTVLPLFLVFSR